MADPGLRALLISFALLLSCAPTADHGVASGGAAAPLLAERSIPVLPAGYSGVVRARLMDFNDAHFLNLADYTEQYCSQIATEMRYETGFSTTAAEDYGLPAQLRLQAIRLCMGYQFLALAESVAPIDITGGPMINDVYDVRPRRPGDTAPALGLLMTVPVLRGSDAAAAAMMSALLFQMAATDGRELMMSPYVDEPGLIESTIPSVSGEQVTVGFVIVAQSTEAVQQMEEAGNVASRLIAAAAQERHALDPDPARARANAWRARNDSRLEIANLWFGVPDAAFDPLPGQIADGLAATGDYPTITWVPTRDSERRAVEILRTSRVDPTPVMGTSVADRVRMVLQAEHPDAFSMSLTTETFLERIGVDEDELKLAARFLVQEADVLGRPLVRETTMEPHRVSGTSQTSGRTESTYIAGHTLGAITRSDGDPTQSSMVQLALPSSYCNAGLLQTKQCLGIAIHDFIETTEVTPPAAEAGSPTEAEAHSGLPYVGHVCVGASMEVMSVDVTDDVRFRLIGIAPDDCDATCWSQRVELWWSDAGRDCALRSHGTTACAQYRIDVVPTILDYGDRRALSWSVEGEDLPEGQAIGTGEYSIPTSGRIYVTERDSSSRPRRGVTGFVLFPGTDGGSFSRCTFLPIGPDVLDRIDILSADAEDPSAPATACAGLGGPLPLQDVITASGTSAEFVEAAFLHYLDRAESSAARAEQLGERLIAEQMDMNSMAEQSIQRVNQICGTTLSAGRVSINPPETCDVDADCLNGAPCETGRCRASAIDLVDASPEDLSRLRRCLADEAAPEPASLGEVPLCAWVFEGELCGCDTPGTCAGCPIPFDGTACETVFATGAPSGASIFQTEPLGLVRPSAPAITAERSACMTLARVRTESNSATDASTVRMADWFTQLATQGVAQSLRVTRSFGGFTSIDRGGRPWLSNGSLYVNPAGALVPTACQIDPDLTSVDIDQICSSSARFGRSIRCGWGSCGSDVARTGAGARMTSAVHALRLLSGVDIETLNAGPWNNGDATDYSSGPIPSWIGLEGRLVTRRWDVAGDQSDVRMGRCLDIESYGGSMLVTSWWPQCTTGAIATIRQDIPYAVADAHSRAVALWDPRRETLTPPGEGRFLTVHGLVDTAVNRAPLPGGTLHLGTVVLPVDSGDGVTYVNVTPDRAFDALELACASLESDVGGCSPELDVLPTIESVEDIDRLAAQMRCAADRFDSTAERLVFMDIPPVVASDVGSGRISGTFPAYSGDYGSLVAELRRAMEGIVAATRRVAGTVRDTAGDLSIARSRERVDEFEARLRFVRMMARMSSEINRCLAAAAPSVSVGTGVSSSFNTGSIFVCADAVAQLVLANQAAQLEEDIVDAGVGERRTAVAMQFSARMDALADATQALSESFAAINGTLSRMSAMRNEARRELAHALFLDRDDVGQEWVLGRGMRGRHNRTRAQFQEAHRSAVQLAWLARRAIEQRIGFRLRDLHDDLPLVEAPSRWADTVCTTTGVDFYDVWEGDEDQLPRGIQTVGDYVQRLRMFLDAYSLQYPFENASDVVVLSLRDDFPNHARTTCAVAGPNLLRGTEAMAMGEDPVEWRPACEVGEACLEVDATEGRVFPPVDTDPDPMTGVARRGARAVEGGGEVRLSVACPVVSMVADCGGEHDAGGGWAQSLTLGAGEYIVSWYERLVADSETTCFNPLTTGSPRLEVAIEAVEGGTGVTTVTNVGFLDPTVDMEVVDRWVDSCRWRRAAAHVEIEATEDAPELYEFVVRIGSTTSTLDTALSTVDESVFSQGMAGLQIERLTSSVVSLDPDDVALAIRPYFPTDASGEWPVGTCFDRTASDLRAGFRRHCEAALCPAGIGTACIGADEFDPGRRTCYWEATFSLPLDEIERGARIPNGGFAVGNFNYRTDQIAVNLVGTGVRDCSAVPHGAEPCYASGFIPYSLHHVGNWEVRNHAGETTDWMATEIFPGAIVSAKALSAERYLTNPVSSADRAHLTDYWRSEFRGRPLTGDYVIRIHEVPGLEFARIEDIQIAIGYRYWTRQRLP